MQKDERTPTNDLRHDEDAEATRRRAAADSERLSDRALIDGTRQARRGNDQARQGLERERARDDERLRAERDESDAARAKERALADATFGREHEARTAAEAALDARSGRDEGRDSDLRESLALVRRQLELIEGALKKLVDSAPRGSCGGVVDELRAAGARMQHLLEDALDPDDGRRRYHDLGGSG